MLGNLLDNASKWARSPGSAWSPLRCLRAAPTAAAGDWLEIRVDDDGPGLTPEQLAEPIARGRRLDETKPGSGLGHSIVADLAYCYNGKFELLASDVGWPLGPPDPSACGCDRYTTGPGHESRLGPHFCPNRGTINPLGATVRLAPPWQNRGGAA